MNNVHLQSFSGNEELRTLLNEISGSDCIKRQIARKSIVRIGRPALEPLEEMLKSENYRIRWEAAKAISEMLEPAAIPILIKLMDDENEDLRWLGAEGMIELRRLALIPLLREIISTYESVRFCEAAHHILNELTVRKDFSDTTDLLRALARRDAGMQISLRAKAKLEELRGPKI